MWHAGDFMMLAAARGWTWSIMQRIASIVGAGFTRQGRIWNS